MNGNIELDYDKKAYFFDLTPTIHIKPDNESMKWATEIAHSVLDKVNQHHEFMMQNDFSNKVHLKSVEICSRRADHPVRFFIEYAREEDGLIPVKLVNHVKSLLSDTGFFEPF